MKLRIDRVELVGTTRVVEFLPGLNVVTGTISTGKSTLLRLCRMLLGAQVSNLTPEIQQHVPALAGRIVVGSGEYSILRPLVTTDTAKVEIAGEGRALRLPAMRRDATSPTTYGQWLLSELELPVLEVPVSPTKLADSGMSTVSINDYMLYSRLDQDEIDASVFGSRDHWRDVKRRYVLEILYGFFDAEQAALQEELRDVQIRIRQAKTGADQFEEFFTDTPWSNRAEIELRLETAQSSLRSLEEESVSVASSGSAAEPRARVLRTRLQSVEKEIEDLGAARRSEEGSAEDLDELCVQLLAQSERLTRAIVSDKLLLDFDFKVCPRCGADVDPKRPHVDSCYLCLQEPRGLVSRTDLIREQDRLAAQIIETEELATAHRMRSEALLAKCNEAEATRAQVAHELDVHLASYVSDEADRIRDSARNMGELEKTVQQLTDYLQLYEKLDAARLSEAELSQRESELQDLFRLKESERGLAYERLNALEGEFERWVEAFGTPRFDGDPRAGIDRDTYLPILNGRRFANLSSGGLKTLTNLAHALAHHTNALRLGLNLPGILLIDGVTKNVGHDEYDGERVEKVFEALAQISREHGDQLQIIVAANDVPRNAEDFVRLKLSDSDRLVPGV